MYEFSSAHLKLDGITVFLGSSCEWRWWWYWWKFNCQIFILSQSFPDYALLETTWNSEIVWTSELSSSKIGWNLGVCVLTVFLGSSCDWRRWRFWWMRYICEFQHHRISIWPKICNCPCPVEHSGKVGLTVGRKYGTYKLFVGPNV